MKLSLVQFLILQKERLSGKRFFQFICKEASGGNLTLTIADYLPRITTGNL